MAINSAHTLLIPYWDKKLDKDKMVANKFATSGRGLHCKYLDKQVELSEKALTYWEKEISI